MKRAKNSKSVTVRRAQDLLSVVTNHKEDDQQIKPVLDPKNSFFLLRPLTADFDSSMPLSFRPLNIENEFIFEIHTNDPLLFLDVESLMLSFKGTIKEINRNGGKELLNLAPDREMRMVNERVLVHDVTGRAIAREKYKVTTIEANVEHTREFFDGLLVTPAPALPLTVWKNVGVQIGSVTLPNYCRDLFGYQVFVRTLLELKPEPMNAQLRGALFILDTHSSMEPGDLNAGLTERFTAGGNSKTFHYSTPLLVDGLSSWRHGRRLLPGNCPLRLTFERADPRMCLTAYDESAGFAVNDRNFFMEVEEPLIHVRSYKMSPAAYKNFTNDLQRQHIQIDYPCHPVDYKLIHKNSTTFRFSIPNKPCNPDKFFFTLLETDQFRGSYDSNSFWLMPLGGLSKVEVDFGDGAKKLELNASFETNNFGQFYNFFLSENNISLLRETMPLVPPEYYNNGRFGFVLDLTPNHNYGRDQIRVVPSTQTIEITLHFSVRFEQIVQILTVIIGKGAGLAVRLLARGQHLYRTGSVGATERLMLEEYFESVDDVRKAFFRTPFRFVLVGPSESGKSVFTRDILSSLGTLYPPNYFKKVRYFHGVWSSAYTQLLEIVPGIEFVAGGPSPQLLSQLCSDEVCARLRPEDDRELWVLDDLLELLNDKSCGIDTIYTKLSHHSGISVLFTSQLLFQPSGPNLLKTIISNATCLFLWRNFKDQRSLYTLSSQIFAGQPSDFLSSALQQLHRLSPYEPLVIALGSHFVHDKLRVAAGVLPSDKRLDFRVFLPDWSKSQSKTKPRNK